MQQAYFQQLTRCLKEQGNGQPQLILDLALFDENLRSIRASFPAHLQPRLVVKSLANLQLLKRTAQTFNTQSFMIFHLPHLFELKNMFKAADFLLGKPMPIQALHTLVKQDQALLSQVQWLIDSESRLEQYLQFAQQFKLQLKLNLEIDIGLHRGGFHDFTVFKEVLKRIRSESAFLKLSGLMGYDAHVSKLPKVVFSTIKSYQKSQQCYQRFIDELKQTLPELDMTQLCLNGAGSTTLQHHFIQTVCNDLSFGSLLLKPYDFEVEGLEQLNSALWIAAPILKRLESVTLPGLELLQHLPYAQSAICIYGGYWRGVCEYPIGAKPHPLYGRSTNQELLQIPQQCQINVDDYVFIRPAQSETILPQFSHLYVYDHQVMSAWENFRE